MVRVLLEWMGGLDTGAPADFCVIDLNDLSLAGTNAQSLKSDLVFSLNTEAIRSVYVQGEAVLQDRQHPHTHEFVNAYRDYMKTLS